MKLPVLLTRNSPGRPKSFLAPAGGVSDRREAPGAVLLALLARLEPRHWLALVASAVLHLAVYLGLDKEPPPEPKPVSFEIALEPPKPEAPTRAKSQVKTRTADAKAKKTQAKRKPAQREPHTLEAKWRGEAKPAKDTPKLELPDARTLGVQAPLEEIVKPAATTRPSMAQAEAKPEAVQAEAPGAAQAAAQATSQAAEAAQLADPGAGGGSLASAGGSAGDPGIALAASSSLSRGGLQPGGLAAAEEAYRPLFSPGQKVSLRKTARKLARDGGA